MSDKRDFQKDIENGIYKNPYGMMIRYPIYNLVYKHTTIIEDANSKQKNFLCILMKAMFRLASFLIG